MKRNVATETVIRGGQVLTPNGDLRVADLIINGETISEIKPRASIVGAQVIDAEHCLVLPGIVDIHGDTFERNIMPRAKTMFPLSIAILESDRQLAANGITTAYHGITISWEPGLRSLVQAQKIIQAIDDTNHSQLIDNRIHVRWETFAIEEVPAVVDLFRRSKKPALAFNDHTTLDMDGQRPIAKLRGAADRAMLDIDGYNVLLQQRKSYLDEVPVAIDLLSSIAREYQIPMLSHDDASVETRSHYRNIGANICEFPMNWETAEDAAGHGEQIVFGAPNVVRGGSHNGAISAAEAIRRGVCTILATDYYYPAPLHAALHLVASGILELEAAWNLISRSPASAMNLKDRGTLESGKRADVILVPTTSTRPVLTMCAGRIVYRCF